MYWWEGSIHADEEVLLQMKTTTAAIEPLFALVQQAHPYDVPELLAVPVSDGSASYLDWVTQVVQP